MIFGLRRVHAFSLVELTLALGVAAFCLVAVFGLMPVGVQTNRNATSQTIATNIIALAVSDLRAAPTGNQVSSLLLIPLPCDPTCATACPPYGATCQDFVPPNFAPCSGGQTSSTSTIRYFDNQGQNFDRQGTRITVSNSRYRLTATPLKNATASAAGGATYYHLKVTWPSAIDPCAITPSGSVEMFAAVDRN